MLDVCLLGSGGTQPLPNRRLSAALVRFGGSLILIDCGEGTQIGIRERAWGLRNLNTILLTHMHADHILGIPGLLLTLAFTGKDEHDPLTIYGPEPLVEILSGLLVVAPRLPYPVHYGVLEGGEQFGLDYTDALTIDCVSVEHDIPCLAYGLTVPRAPRFDPARAEALGVPRSEWRRLQHGESVAVGNRTVVPSDVMGPPRRGVRVVLVTDTRPTPALTRFVQADGNGTDLLISDAMYAGPEDLPKRWESQHLTFAEAATLARDGGARRLWLTHFGPALTDPAAYLDRATSIFPNTEAGYDLLTDSLTFDDE
ncbi:MAG: Ribonuclease [Chloroflexi bacterium]|jgi:ribonuclease Z|nr:Ribonuclease [Chloroflexota bacterium]